MSILYYNQKVKPELYIETFKRNKKIIRAVTIMSFVKHRHFLLQTLLDKPQCNKKFNDKWC